jgi:nucleoside-diphosphate-sugar epimerase
MSPYRALDRQGALDGAAADFNRASTELDPRARPTFVDSSPRISMGRREFLHVDDLADAVLYLLQPYDAEPMVNIGWGENVTIGELAENILSVIGYSGRLVFDAGKPDGTPRKLLDVSRMTDLGWRPRISLKEGIERTYAWFKEHSADARL